MSNADFILCSRPKKYTVGGVRVLLSSADEAAKLSLVDIIDHRLRGRYLHPLQSVSREAKSGFLMMAVACLLIEALESFRLGIDDTKGKGRKIFEEFFAREGTRFPGLAGPEAHFYEHVRCGLLHQAEARGGYRIVRTGALLSSDKAINANRFTVTLTTCLDDYLGCLRASDLNSDLWIKAKRKLEFICNNCALEQKKGYNRVAGGS